MYVTDRVRPAPDALQTVVLARVSTRGEGREKRRNMGSRGVSRASENDADDVENGGGVAENGSGVAAESGDGGSAESGDAGAARARSTTRVTGLVRCTAATSSLCVVMSATSSPFTASTTSCLTR